VRRPEGAGSAGRGERRTTAQDGTELDRLPLDLVNGQARRATSLEVKTGNVEGVARGDVNQLLGQIEVETKRAAKARVYGCLLTPATVTKDDAAEAARDKIALMSHEAAVRLYDVLADRLRHYAALCGDGNAEARGDARTKKEALLPADGWLGRLLAPTQGKVIGVDDVAGLFPPR